MAYYCASGNGRGTREAAATGGNAECPTAVFAGRTRSYHPTLGNWVSRDPIGYDDSTNLYAYCSLRPGTFTDSLGLAAEADKASDPIMKAPNDFDLVVTVAPDVHVLDFQRQLEAYGREFNTPVGYAASVDELVKLIETTGENKRKAAGKDVKLKIMIIGHGDDDTGPFVGPGRVSEKHPKQEPILVAPPGGADIGRTLGEARNEFSQSNFFKLKGIIREIWFTDCNIARGDDAKSLLSALSADLGAIIVAGSRKITTAVGAKGIDIIPVYEKGDTQDWYNFIHTFSDGKMVKENPK